MLIVWDQLGKLKSGTWRLPLTAPWVTWFLYLNRSFAPDRGRFLGRPPRGWEGEVSKGIQVEFQELAPGVNVAGGKYVVRY